MKKLLSVPFILALIVIASFTVVSLNIILDQALHGYATAAGIITGAALGSSTTAIYLRIKYKKITNGLRAEIKQKEQDAYKADLRSAYILTDKYAADHQLEELRHEVHELKEFRTEIAGLIKKFAIKFNEAIPEVCITNSAELFHKDFGRCGVKRPVAI
jgi:hypothetical protein